MREVRSVVNAFFYFAIFLLLRALFVPGPPGGSGPARFVHMEIRESGPGGEHVRLTIPHFLFRSGLALASTRKLQRELDFHTDETVEVSRLREMWAELSGKPDGTEAKRAIDHSEVSMRREGEMVVLTISELDWPPEPPDVPEAPEAPEVPDVPEPPKPPLPGATPSHAARVPPPPAAPTVAPPPTPAPAPAPRLDSKRTLTIKFPIRFFEALTRDEGRLDIRGLVQEMRRARRGDVLEITSDDARVKVWLD